MFVHSIALLAGKRATESKDRNEDPDKIVFVNRRNVLCAGSAISISLSETVLVFARRCRIIPANVANIYGRSVGCCCKCDRWLNVDTEPCCTARLLSPLFVATSVVAAAAFVTSTTPNN